MCLVPGGRCWPAADPGLRASSARSSEGHSTATHRAKGKLQLIYLISKWYLRNLSVLVYNCKILLKAIAKFRPLLRRKMQELC